MTVAYYVICFIAGVLVGAVTNEIRTLNELDRHDFELRQREQRVRKIKGLS